MMTSPIQNALLGGLLIGFSTSLLMWSIGKICGLSGIFSGLIFSIQEKWRWYFIIGFLLGSLGVSIFENNLVSASIFNLPLLWSIVAGLLVGYGTRLSGGCTSGHGICGVSRLSKRSIVATVLFMGAAILTVWIRKHL